MSLLRPARRGKLHLSNALPAQSAVNVWITSSSPTSVTCVASYLLTFDIITSRELISRLESIRRCRSNSDQHLTRRLRTERSSGSVRGRRYGSLQGRSVVSALSHRRVEYSGRFCRYGRPRYRILGRARDRATHTSHHGRTASGVLHWIYVV
jgi:hypothetical protein